MHENHQQLLAWHYFKCFIPNDWECTNYNIDAKKGRLQFNTRNGLEATLHWQIHKHNIDAARMLNEIHRRHLDGLESKLAETFSQLNQRQIGDFVFAHDCEGRIAHASFFNKEHKIHLHWIFNNYTPERANEWEHILNSFALNIDEKRLWALFKIRGLLPQSYAPVEVEAVPANVSLVFEGPRHHHVYLRRFGLPEILLNGSSLFSFYGNYQKKLRRRIVAKNECEFMGMPAISLDIEQRGEYSMEKLAGRWWTGTATLWHNQEEQRMYCFEQVGAKKAVSLELSDVFQA